MNTKTECLYPIFGCLDEFEKCTDTKKWSCQNDRQFDIIEAKKSINLELIPELESISDHDTEVINEFLEKKGFDIRLHPEIIPGWAAASVLNVKTKWKYECEETEFAKNGVKFDAFEMGNRGFKFYKNDVIELITEGSDRLFLSMQTDVPEKLEEWINQQDVENRVWAHVDKVILPKIKYDKEVDITWMEGMRNEKGDWISQALQQTKFSMDEKGTHLESAAAMFLCTGSMMMGEKIYTVDEPFIVMDKETRFKNPIAVCLF